MPWERLYSCKQDSNKSKSHGKLPPWKFPGEFHSISRQTSENLRKLFFAWCQISYLIVFIAPTKSKSCFLFFLLFPCSTEDVLLERNDHRHASLLDIIFLSWKGAFLLWFRLLLYSPPRKHIKPKKDPPLLIFFRSFPLQVWSEKPSILGVSNIENAVVRLMCQWAV